MRRGRRDRTEQQSATRRGSAVPGEHERGTRRRGQRAFYRSWKEGKRRGADPRGGRKNSSRGKESNAESAGKGRDGGDAAGPSGRTRSDGEAASRVAPCRFASRRDGRVDLKRNREEFRLPATGCPGRGNHPGLSGDEGCDPGEIPRWYTRRDTSSEISGHRSSTGDPGLDRLPEITLATR